MKNFFDLLDFLDKEKNKTAYVCGMGPSLKKYLEKVESTNNVVIACSDVDYMTGIIPNYWVFANSLSGSAPNMNDRWKNFKDTVIVHAYSVDPTPNSWIEENVTSNYIGYDQSHFNDSDCPNCPGGCYNRIPSKKTIQEILMDKSKHEKMYSPGSTVALHCLALAILLGCNEIYLFGVDLDYSLGYIDNKTINNGSFSEWMPGILEDFKIINESAKKIGVNIYNMSETSPLKEIFESRTTL